MAVLYDRVLRHKKIPNTFWNTNVPARSMKDIRMLFEDPYRTSTEEFYNPKIEKVEITIEDVPNQLYSQGIKPYQQWKEINRVFALTYKRSKEANKVAKELYFTSTTLEKYLTDHYAFWLDFRSTDDNSIYGSGRKLENTSEGITFQTYI